MGLFQMSVSGAALILLTVIVRSVALETLPKMTFRFLWGVALFRLLLPVDLPFPAAVPLSPACEAAPDPLAHALGDGEDFELLFTVPPDDEGFAAEFRRAFPGTRCTRVGAVGDPLAGGLGLCGSGPGARELPQCGFDRTPRDFRALIS